MIKKDNTILRKGYYSVAIISVVIFLVGMLLVGVGDFPFFTYHNIEYVIIGVPFSIWAWLIIVGLLFVKKNWIVIAIIIASAIPHIIAIALLYAFSYSILEILKWYVMILSFGSIVL
ncbi:hypothetical protein [Anaerococcus sp. Marseille-P3915]|uniref:hypothetical protein n=1 Tax=Anaerococcus sp. Marseille-P3915 TaxID=2057799 RepID=UPI000D0AD24E|nr:hypothetical protein [Anaerococcus sp. Marseille-P3915]